MKKDFERLRLVTSAVRGRASGQELWGEGEGCGAGGRGCDWMGEDDPSREDGNTLGSVVIDDSVVIIVVNDVDIVVVVIKIVVVV